MVTITYLQVQQPSNHLTLSPTAVKSLTENIDPVTRDHFLSIRCQFYLSYQAY